MREKLDKLREKLTGRGRQVKIGICALAVAVLLLFLTLGGGARYVRMTISEYAEAGSFLADGISSDNHIGRLIQKIHRWDQAAGADQTVFPQITQYKQADFMPEEIEIEGTVYQQVGYGTLENDAYTEPLSDRLAGDVAEFTVSLDETGETVMKASRIDGVDMSYAVAVTTDKSVSLHTYLYVNPAYCEEHTLTELLEATGILNAYVNMKDDKGSFWLHYVNVPAEYLTGDIFAGVGIGVSTEGEAKIDDGAEIQKTGLSVILQTGSLENIAISFLDDGSLEVQYFFENGERNFCYDAGDTSLAMGTGLLKYLRKNGTLMEWNGTNYGV